MTSFTPTPVKPIVPLSILASLDVRLATIQAVAEEGMLFDIGYADGLTPALAVPERALPDGARAG